MRIDLVSVTIAGLIAWQAPPPASQAPKKESTVQVRGCLQGQSLTLTEDPGFEVPNKRIDLTGDRRLMKAFTSNEQERQELRAAIAHIED